MDNKKELDKEELTNVSGGDQAGHYSSIKCPKCGEDIPVTEVMVLNNIPAVCPNCNERVDL